MIQDQVANSPSLTRPNSPASATTKSTREIIHTASVGALPEKLRMLHLSMKPRSPILPVLYAAARLSDCRFGKAPKTSKTKPSARERADKAYATNVLDVRLNVPQM